MQSVVKEPFGFAITFRGIVSAAEMAKWKEDAEKALIGAPKKFGVLVDMRTLQPLAADAQAILLSGRADSRPPAWNEAASFWSLPR